MSEKSVFDRLVSDLSSTERRELLSRIGSSVEISESPLREDPEHEKVNIERVYNEMSLWQKFLVLLTMIFTGKEREFVVTSRFLHERARQLQPGLEGKVDFAESRFLPGFKRELEAFRDAVRYFKEPLTQVLGVQKRQFIGFLFGIISPELQSRLALETDARRYSSDAMDEREIRKALDANLKAVMESIPAEVKQKMYDGVRFLHHVQTAAAHPFIEFFERFHADSGTASFAGTGGHLRRLLAVVEGLNVKPSVELIEALYLFVNEAVINETPEKAEEILKRQIRGANTAIESIRMFVASMPLYDITVIVTEDLNMVIPEQPGGEDWLQQLQRFWHERIEQRWLEFSFTQKRQDLMREAERLTGVPGLEPFPRYYAANSDSPGSFAFTLGAIRAFFDKPFSEKIHGTLKILMIDGEFYRDDNRKEYTDAFNTLQRIPELLRKLEMDLGEEGEFGSSFAQVRNDKASAGVKRKRRQSITSHLDDRAAALVTKTIESLRSVHRVVHGVLHGEVGGSYDTLQNLGQIAGRGNKAYVKRLSDGLDKLSDAEALFSDLFNMESVQANRAG